MKWILEHHIITRRSLLRMTQEPIADWVVDRANYYHADRIYIIKETDDYADVAFCIPETVEGINNA
jgi:hypothetical protein